MTINLANNNPRIAYTVAQGATQQTFAVPFEFFNDSDISVYVDSVLKTEGVDYTLTGGDGSTGNVIFVTATPPAVQQVLGATGGSTVVIVRSTDIERTSDFSAGSDINRAALNEQLDILTAMIADLNSKVDRSPTLHDYDVVEYQMTIPPTAQRSGKYLAFGANGDLVVTSGTTSSIIVSTFGATLVDDVNAAAALVTLGITSTAAELNILDGVTSNAAELNILDGVTATTAELNYNSGVTSAIQTQLNAKAALASPALTGTPTAPTAAAATNTTQIATTAFVTTADNLKANLASPTLTGTPTAPTAANLTNTTQLATTAFVLANIPLAGPMTLLGTLTTTSGTTQTLSGLTLTGYAALLIVVDGVSHDNATSRQLRLAGQQISTSGGAAASVFNGPIFVSLASGQSITMVLPDTGTASFRASATAITTASTSLSFTWDGAGNFDAGSIKVWGIK